MFLKTVKLLLLCSLLLSNASFAAELILTGAYHGMNLYVQNPHDGDNNYCISEVYVNNKRVEAPKSTAFDIDLSHLQMNDPVTIKIIHDDACQPKVINPNVIRARDEFQFTSIEVTESKINWVSRGEKKFGQYFIESFKNNAWVVEKVYNCKGEAGNMVYNIDVSHGSGMNKYRVKYLEISGRSFYSPEISHYSESERVGFFPKSVTTTITFTRPVKYEVLDVYYNMIMKGNSLTIDCSTLKPGSYFLVFDNRTEKFLKK